MPPTFAQTVEARFAELTPTAKRIASYLLANLDRLGLETADQIAQQAGTSGISVGRFLRSVGYRNLDDLKRELRGTHRDRPWMITDRLDAFRRASGEHGEAAHARQAPQTGNPVTPSPALAHSLDLEIGAIQHVYQLAQSPTFARVAERISSADAVYILGIQSTRGISNAFYSYLEYIRPRVFYSDGMSGSYVDSLNSEFASPYLIVTDTRAYSMIARRYCEAATRRGLPFALVTDIYCPWARDFAADLLQVKTDVGQFWDSLAPLTCLFNLLITAIVERLGPTLDERVARNRELQGELNQFDL
ncbi:sap1 transcriptional regulator SapR [Paraburkholderia sp. 22099]|uniref:sap1 transcriptional regulator SapR n=1 Tax=Paraburkholderia TaxID=1822464 RepID=UPI002856100D|nr:MurR/RpiR family transcriptional regulator [Paraburkholderia terricola]MDR6494600.1 DNA-binding MurR/RpiR family transcriptional regulator [Paraburkholderia terricola]